MPSFPIPFTVLLGKLPALVRLELTRLLQAQPDCLLVDTACSTDELVILVQKLMRARGGRVNAQSQNSAAVFSMPGSVIRAGYAHAVLPLDKIAEAINQRAMLSAPASHFSIPLATLN